MIFLKLLKIILLVFVSLFLALSVSVHHDAFGFSYDYVDSLLEKHDFDQALIYLDEVLEENPDHLDSLFYKGYVLDEMGRYDEALQNYDLVLNYSPDDFETLYNKAITLEHLEEYGEAIRHYDRVLDLYPDDVDSLFSKGVLLYDMGSYHESKDLFEKVLKIDPNDDDARAFVEKNNQQILQDSPVSDARIERTGDGFDDRKIERSADRQGRSSANDMMDVIVDNNVLLGGIGIVIALGVYWYFSKIRQRG